MLPWPHPLCRQPDDLLWDHLGQKIILAHSSAFTLEERICSRKDVSLGIRKKVSLLTVPVHFPHLGPHSQPNRFPFRLVLLTKQV